MQRATRSNMWMLHAPRNIGMQYATRSSCAACNAQRMFARVGTPHRSDALRRRRRNGGIVLLRCSSDVPAKTFGSPYPTSAPPDAAGGTSLNVIAYLRSHSGADQARYPARHGIPHGMVSRTAYGSGRRAAYFFTSGRRRGLVVGRAVVSGGSTTSTGAAVGGNDGVARISRRSRPRREQTTDEQQPPPLRAAERPCARAALASKARLGGSRGTHSRTGHREPQWRRAEPAPTHARETHARPRSRAHTACFHHTAARA